MRKRYLIGSGLVLLAILLTLVVWQVSLKVEYGPANTAQTFVFWAVSTLIFLLTVMLGFMLFREGVKLYISWQSSRDGSASGGVPGALTNQPPAAGVAQAPPNTTAPTNANNTNASGLNAVAATSSTTPHAPPML